MSRFEALVEVKTGDAKLDAEQINAYIEIARLNNHDCVITISNEIAPSPGCSSDRRIAVEVELQGSGSPHVVDDDPCRGGQGAHASWRG